MSKTTPRVIGSEYIFDTFAKVRCDILEYESTYRQPYYVVETAAESVGVICLDSDGKILLTQEYRHAVKSVVWGCPAGLLEPDETPLQGASRELLEETGFQGESYTYLGAFFPLPGLLAQRMHVVLAENAKQIQEPTLDLCELITCRFYPREFLQSLMCQKAPVDGTFAAAVMLWESVRQKEQLHFC